MLSPVRVSTLHQEEFYLLKVLESLNVFVLDRRCLLCCCVAQSASVGSCRVDFDLPSSP